MRNPLKRMMAPLEIARIVDGGRVHCPVQLADIDVDRCAGCSYLHRATAADGQLTEIVCKPPYAAFSSLGQY